MAKKTRTWTVYHMASPSARSRALKSSASSYRMDVSKHGWRGGIKALKNVSENKRLRKSKEKYRQTTSKKKRISIK